MTSWRHVLLLGPALLTLSGCTALGVTGGAVAVAALGAGTGEVVRAGTEYRLGGTAYRTFTVPLDELHEVTRATLIRMALKFEREETTSPGRLIVASGIGRIVEVRLEPITPELTTLSLVVKRTYFRRDRATASEIITQIELALRPSLTD
jgi:hypothetical protein